MLSLPTIFNCLVAHKSFHCCSCVPWPCSIHIKDGASIVGMHPNINASPVTAELMQSFPSDSIAYDLIYTPSPTQFLKQAQGQGAVIFDGLQMLVQQGAIALEKWLDQPVPVDTMRQALLNHLAKKCICVGLNVCV